jgi:hypothetical protein
MPFGRPWQNQWEITSPKDVSELVSEVYLDGIIVGGLDREFNDSSGGRDALAFKHRLDLEFGSAENGPVEWC